MGAQGPGSAGLGFACCCVTDYPCPSLVMISLVLTGRKGASDRQLSAFPGIPDSSVGTVSRTHTRGSGRKIQRGEAQPETGTVAGSAHMTLSWVFVFCRSGV